MFEYFSQAGVCVCARSFDYIRIQESVVCVETNPSTKALLTEKKIGPRHLIRSHAP